MNTYVKCVEAWLANQVTLDEAVAAAVPLVEPPRMSEPDGDVWWDGEFDNTALALFALFPDEEYPAAVDTFWNALQGAKEPSRSL